MGGDSVITMNGENRGGLSSLRLKTRGGIAERAKSCSSKQNKKERSGRHG